MDLKFRRFIFYQLLLILLILPGRAICQPTDQKEFRGIWIATINNLDWPSAPGLSVEQQKKELKDLIDRIAKYNLNAVFFQVRAASDAFYASSLEPWSYFLTGKQGKSNQPFFDPLAYAIELCHARGIELHAWFNPFRVRNLGHYEFARSSFAAKFPQYQHDYDNKRFFDPGFPQVRSHVISAILEVVRNYDIDAVLLDDYFYPYPIKGKSFPDSKTFAKYGKEYYPKHLKDWRRNNINSFIAQLHDSIKSVKPSLRLGISPFGVWRTKADDPNGSPLVKGTTSYDDLYADVYKWLANDWIDYVIPQLYWEQGNRYGDFNSLAKWWNDHSFGKTLYLGQALYRSTGSGASWSNPKEINDQISLLRKYKNIKGFAFFSASHLFRLPETANRELIAQLATSTNDSTGTKTSSPGNALLTSSAGMDLKLTINENSFDSIINLTNRTEKQSSLPIDLKLRKQHKNWVISWNWADSLKINSRQNVLISYRIKKGTGYRRNVYILNDHHQLLISKNDNYNPRKDLYSLVSIDPANGEKHASGLIRIKRNRIVYWRQ
mgnify:CR=1 FL=1